jgi:Zn-dependent M28 family amino/carboxypeptidase
MRILISALLLAGFLAAQAPKPALKPPPEDAAPGFNSIKPEDCKEWLTKLASDEFEGRETGTEGFQKAADMIAGQFREFGLKAVGDKDASGVATYFQMVPFVASALDGEKAVFEVTGGKDPIRLKAGEGFGATGLGALSAEGLVTFVFVMPNQGKIPEFDVKGRVVVVIACGSDGEPVMVPSGVINDLRKVKPAAIVRINDAAAAAGVKVSEPERKDRARAVQPGRAPVPVISKAVAQKVASAAGKDLAAAMTKARSAGEAQSLATKLTAKIELATKVVDIPAPNVVGYLEGSDPTLKNELIIIGSHLDHLGRSSAGALHPGADDDASGSTGVLAVARAFTKNGRAPKRSVLFMAFCGEEKGLLGSDWYVAHPIFPLANVVAELQMDMIGRREENHPSENSTGETAEQNVNSLHLIGAKKIAPVLNDICEKINKESVGFDFEYDQEGVYYRSDHYNFARKGIPIAFFFTGFHMDYHQPSDKAEKIDFPKLARVAQLVYLIAWDLAERPQRLPIEKGKKPERDK